MKFCKYIYTYKQNNEMNKGYDVTSIKMPTGNSVNQQCRPFIYCELDSYYSSTNDNKNYRK